LPSISWSTYLSCCFQIRIKYPFGDSIFFHSLYMSKPTFCSLIVSVMVGFFSNCVNFFIS
jgi:hypothetical protein